QVLPNLFDIFSRCLIEVGDVAFVKDSTVNDNTAGESKPAWAGNKTPDDFVLLKPDGTRCPVTQFRECGLATVPTHAVVTRLEKQKQVQSALCQQQKLFGNNGSRKDEFQMFQSQFKDDLFKDGTLCLVVPKETTYEGFLGQDYLESIAGLKSCSPSELLKAGYFISEDNLQEQLSLQ
ncbi:ovotransferrin-like, partial [Varanus komodoensis]|uniref:ovotransferrin-like n=1 Tax=Varanus komodoensis TaxID=61221 RepID=UPI001CF7D5FE